MKAPITQEELKHRLLQCGGISPDDAENAAVMELLDRIEALEKVAEAAKFDRKELHHPECRCHFCAAVDALDAADAEEK